MYPVSGRLNNMSHANGLTDTITVRLTLRQIEELRKLKVPLTASAIVRVLLELYFAGRIPHAIIPLKKELSRIEDERLKSRIRFVKKIAA